MKQANWAGPDCLCPGQKSFRAPVIRETATMIVVKRLFSEVRYSKASGIPTNATRTRGIGYSGYAMEKTDEKNRKSSFFS